MKPNWFAAVPIDASWLSSLLADLPPECRGFVAEDVHMTVAFFGAMDPARQDQLNPIFENLRQQAFQMTLADVIALPSPKRCSALSVAVKAGPGRDKACALIAHLRGPLQQAVNARPDERPPLPHITIARPIRKYKAEGRRIALTWAQAKPPLDVMVRLDRLALYTWAEDRRTRQFQIVKEVPFLA